MSATDRLSSINIFALEKDEEYLWIITFKGYLISFLTPAVQFLWCKHDADMKLKVLRQMRPNGETEMKVWREH